MKQTVFLVALFSTLVGCASSHDKSGLLVTCSEVRADPRSFQGAPCSEESIGSSCSGDGYCAAQYFCRDGEVIALQPPCPERIDCDIFTLEGGQVGDPCNFFSECPQAECSTLVCEDGIATLRDVCTKPTITCDEFIVSNLPLGTECDEEIFGRCGGQDEFCCGGPEHWCEDGVVVAGIVLDCACQPPSTCDVPVGTMLREDQCDALSQCAPRGIAGVPCCFVSKLCDPDGQVIETAEICQDDCEQGCDLVQNETDCNLYGGCEWFISDACTDEAIPPRPPRCIDKRETRCDFEVCPGGQTCEAFEYNPCRGLPCAACYAQEFWCQ